MKKNILQTLKSIIFKRSYKFTTSERYWNDRYQFGGDSGVGSYGKFSKFKADVINEFVESNDITTVIEFGSGDGSQLKLAKYPSYLGVDISPDAVERCRSLFANDSTKKFIETIEFDSQSADLVLSLDVIYHLVEDSTFDQYMQQLFLSAKKYAIIYSSNSLIESDAPHVKHRIFTDWIKLNQPEWKLKEHIPNKHPYSGDYKEGSFADFYIFENTQLET